jgi:hypothetical protein
LAANLAHELASPSLQDPSLAEWWAAAAELRRGGVDRILVPEPWSPTIAELTARGVRGVVYGGSRAAFEPEPVEQQRGSSRKVTRTRRPENGLVRAGRISPGQAVSIHGKVMRDAGAHLRP